MVGCWLLKTEPEEWSWDHQQANGGISQWDGVRNAQAQKHLRAMEVGDLCFFYHSGAKAKEIVGIARVCKTFYPDPSDASSKHGMVDVEAVSKLCEPLALSRLKQEDGLLDFIMFRQPRLSVVPVSNAEWKLICKLAGQLEPPLLVDGNNGFRVGVNDQALELGNGEARAINKSRMCRIEPKDCSPHHNADFRDRVSDQIAHCHDKIRVSVLDVGGMTEVVKRQPRKHKIQLDATSGKLNGLLPPSEASKPSPIERHVVESNLVASNNLFGMELDERSITVEAVEDDDTCTLSDSIIKVKSVPDSKRVYSRRSRKLGEVRPFSIIAEVNDSKDMARGDGGRVYKRRNR